VMAEYDAKTPNFGVGHVYLDQPRSHIASHSIAAD